MLRISTTENAMQGVITLSLEGRAVGPWVDELERVATAALSRAPRVIIDLENVTFLDGRAVTLLRTLEAQRCQLSQRSLFVDAQLRTTTVP